MTLLSIGRHKLMWLQLLKVRLANESLLTWASRLLPLI
jgi:hypothetical protein